METIKAIKRKVRIFLSNEQRRRDGFTVVALLFLTGVFTYSFLYAHLGLEYGGENIVSIFKGGQGLTGFAERMETMERIVASSEEDTSSPDETDTQETASEPTSRTIARQTTTTTLNSALRTVSRTPATDLSVSSTAPATTSRTPSASIDSSISRIISPTKVERKITSASEEKKVTRTPAKPAIVRTAMTPIQSFDSVKTETIPRKSAIVVQRTTPSLTKALITISRKPVTDLGEETVQKIEEEVKKIEENPKLPAVRQVLEKSLEEKKMTLVLAANPGAQTIAPKLIVTINKKPTERYNPLLNQPWNPLGLFNAMLYGKKTVKTHSFSTGNDQSLIAQQLDISSLKKGEYEVFTQLTDEGKVLSSDRTDFSSEGKE